VHRKRKRFKRYMTTDNKPQTTRHSMLRPFRWLVIPAVAAVVLILNPPQLGWSKVDTTATGESSAELLQAQPKHGEVSRMVARFAERAHYEKMPIDDELSAALLKTYIKSLDNNRHHFLASDIIEFQKYRNVLDDTLRANNMDPAFDIFRTYQMRATGNVRYAISILDEEPDFTIDESYEFDREELAWAADEAELQDIWRKRVKNDALSLMLAGKTWEETAEMLSKRYTRLLERLEEIDSDDVMESFLNAFAHTLDPHSSYMSPRNSEEYRIQMSLSYQGIGASLQMEDDYVTVLNVIAGGPAAIDGKLKANDRITGVAQGVDGEVVDVIGWELDDVVQLIRGERGTVVRLQILGADMMPGDQESILQLTRDKIKLEERAAQSEVIDIERNGNSVKVGVISVPSFYMDFEARSRGEKDYVSTTRDVRALINELQEDGVVGIVMDLRGNGGGHLSEATALSGLFIEQGPVVQLRDTTGRIEVLDDPEPALAYNGPLVVLVDRFSASASEIFAGAIQDYGRGIVIGQQTFGKGTVQNLYDLDQYARRNSEGLGQLTLTIGKYYRVTGDSTQNRGVLPDVELPSSLDPSRIGESSRPGALPWDRIRAANFKSYGNLDTKIVQLRDAQVSRTTDDADFNFLLESIAASEELRNQTSISLNLDTRKLEQEERRDARLERENTRRAANGEEALADNEALEEAERPDVILNQAAEILTDLSVLLEIASNPGVLSRNEP